ncbi:MAG: DUF1307 domain-containing protein [Tissierellia bacterium]|nr:DUF1307 domain-containing protein [Tissierellia bacterium]
MKRKSSFLVVLLILTLIITACGKGSGGSDTTVYYININGVESTLTYESNGDVVTKQKVENVITYKDSPVIKNKEDAKKLFTDELINSYKQLEGIEYDVQISDEKAVETMVVDFSSLDFEKAKKLEGFAFSGDPKNGISLKKSEELLFSQGYKKK